MIYQSSAFYLYNPGFAGDESWKAGVLDYLVDDSVNFLAHSLLAFDDTQLMAGQFCGDFVRGSDLSRFPEGVEKGIRLHRYLDLFADRHELLGTEKRKLTLVPQRFCSVLVDVLFDHYLATHWSTVSSLPLPEHVSYVHQSLQEHEHLYPDSMKRFVSLLQAENILQNNQHLSSIEFTLKRLSRRSTKFSALAVSARQLEPVQHQLLPSFAQFYPDLHAAAVQYLDRHSDTEHRVD